MTPPLKRVPWTSLKKAEARQLTDPTARFFAFRLICEFERILDEHGIAVETFDRPLRGEREDLAVNELPQRYG